MRGSLFCRNAAAGALLLAVAVAPAAAAAAARPAAAMTVASVKLEVPATGAHAAGSLDVASYELDAAADFSLVLLASNSEQSVAARVTLVLPPETSKTAFATAGDASRFPKLTIRESDAKGALLRSTDFYNVRVVGVERINSNVGIERRLTFTADRMKTTRARS